MSTPELLGIDNVLFSVVDLTAARAFYTRCGFAEKFAMPTMALFSIGSEEPGLLLRQGPGPYAGVLWVEVANADALAETLSDLAPRRLETMTGITLEITDPSGNVIGFADYSKKPDLARSQP